MLLLYCDNGKRKYKLKKEEENQGQKQEMVEMKKMKKMLCNIVAATMLTTCIAPNATAVEAATKLKVSASKVILTVGKTKVVTANKKVTWKSSNKKIAKVKKMNGKKAKITAVKNGTCEIVVKYKKQKKVIKVTVKAKATQQGTASPTPVVTAAPDRTQTPEVTSAPAVIVTPTPGVTSTPAVIATPTPEVTSTPAVTATPETDIYTETAARVTVKVISGSATGASLEITNGSNTMLTFGLQYEIQKFENGNWVSLRPIKENIAFPALGIGMDANSIRTFDMNWTDYYGVLEKGEYRIVKEYMIDGASYKIASTFLVD